MLSHALRAAAGNGAGGAAVEFIGVVESANNATSYTFNTTAIGDAAADRLVALVIAGTGGSSTADLSSVTVNGNSATLATNFIDSFAAVGVAYIAVPSGTTANIVVNYSSTGKARCAVAVYSITGQASNTPLDTVSQADNTSITIDVPEGAAAIFGLSAAGTYAPTTWTGATEDWDAQIAGEGTTFSTAHTQDQTTSYNVTAGYTGGSSNQAYTAVSWS